MLLIVCHTTTAQYNSTGADNFAMASSLVALPCQSSIFNNPAGIAFSDGTYVGINYYKVLPVQAFNTLGAWAVSQKKGFAVGVLADSFGDRYYKESRAGIAASKKLDKVSMGIKFSILNNRIEDYSSRQTVLGEFGLVVTPHKFFNVGLHVINFTRASLYNSQYLPTIISTGTALNLSQKARFTTQIDYILNAGATLKAGLIYTLRPDFDLMTGINPSQKAVHFGLKGKFGNKTFTVSAATLPSVGLSHQFSLQYKIGGK